MGREGTGQNGVNTNSPGCGVRLPGFRPLQLGNLDW